MIAKYPALMALLLFLLGMYLLMYYSPAVHALDIRLGF